MFRRSHALIIAAASASVLGSLISRERPTRSLLRDRIAEDERERREYRKQLRKKWRNDRVRKDKVHRLKGIRP